MSKMQAEPLKTNVQTKYFNGLKAVTIRLNSRGIQVIFNSWTVEKVFQNCKKICNLFEIFL